MARKILQKEIKWSHDDGLYGKGSYRGIVVEYSIGMFKTSGYKYRINRNTVSENIYHDVNKMKSDIKKSVRELKKEMKDAK